MRVTRRSSGIKNKQLLIEHHFRSHVGPVANSIIPQAYGEWRSKYPERLATLLQYVKILANSISDNRVRGKFYSDATRGLVIATPQHGR